MVAVVVQPEDHGRRLGKLHQQVPVSAQSVFTEHGDLSSQLRWIVYFGVAGGEQLMPEEGDLLFQRPLGVYHPVHPFGLIDRRRSGALITREHAVQQFVVYGRLPLWMQKLFDHGFVPLGGALLQFLTGIAEARAPHQVGHQSNFFLEGHCHLSVYRVLSAKPDPIEIDAFNRPAWPGMGSIGARESNRTCLGCGGNKKPRRS